MAGRRTNLALMALLIVALTTGGLAYAIGTRVVAIVVVAHGIAGLAIVLLSPWKVAIARRGIQRRRPGREISLLLAGLVVVCVVTGLVHASGLLVVQGSFSPLGIHVATSLAAVAVGVAHVVQRPVRPRVTDLSRRTVLRTGVLAVAAGAAFAGFGGLLRAGGARGADRRFTGSHETGSFQPSSMPVTQWLDDAVPAVDASTWRLQISGGNLVTRSITIDDLAVFDDRVRATLDCTGGWFAEQGWRGVWLDRLIGDARGASVRIRSATGYARRFPIGDVANVLVATHVGGEALSAGHGFPARLVVPGRRGFWWVKWVVEVRVDDTPWWWQPPFPLT
ncbi:hypothetical protein BH18ACT17_BH18ACT17_12420 [soil metagenome]